MMSMPAVAPWPSFSAEEAEAVQRVILSNRVNYWTGNECREFEREFAAWTGSRRAIALANGTLALDLALKALGVGPGDEVIVSPRTFIASVSCVVNAGARPIFADVDWDSGCISPKTIGAAMTDRTRAVIPVHLAGWPCEMPEICRIAGENDLHVIEDCAQAHGAWVDGKRVGTWGEIGAWSFCQDKIMSTGGEGGMVTTDDEVLWQRMWSFKDHGKDWDAVYNRTHAPGFRWIHESIGTNWRMLEVQAVIGRYQLTRMSAWTSRRTLIAEAIAAALRPFDTAVRVPLPSAGRVHAYYRQYAYVKLDGLANGWSRDRIVAALAEAGVPVFHGSCPEVYLEKAFDGLDCRPAARLPVARDLGETSLMFLTHPTITDEQLGRWTTCLAEIFQQATASN